MPRHTFTNRNPRKSKPVVGLALGSGAARGWAHIGVLHELTGMSIVPDIVVGASVGSIVAGAYASDHLEDFEKWITELGQIDIIRLLDARMAGGGFLQGKRLMGAIEQRTSLLSTLGGADWRSGTPISSAKNRLGSSEPVFCWLLSFGGLPLSRRPGASDTPASTGASTARRARLETGAGWEDLRERWQRRGDCRLARRTVCASAPSTAPCS